jgi:hypothetical protein
MSLRLVIDCPDWIVDRYQETGSAPPAWSQQAMGEAIAAALHGEELRNRRKS